MTENARPPLDPVNTSFIVGTHLVALVGTPAYLIWHGLTWTAVILFFLWSGASIFSISAGYHRLFSHVTYEAHWSLRLFLLLFGAATFQNSALKWALDHRRHHKRCDSDGDPYNIRQGFWHAHIGWVLRKEDPTIRNPPGLDLERDPMVRWQAKHYLAIASVMGLVVPFGIGILLGDPWGGLIIGGVLRIVVLHHVTFSINSFAHFLGTQPYSDKDSSRDSFLTALISMGEGYHNFHHTFPWDYRNGVRIHQFDPTKWLLAGMSFIGVTRNLRRVPRRRILQATLEMDQRRLELRFRGQLPPAMKDRLETVRQLINERMDRFHALMARRDQIKADASRQSQRLLRAIRAEIRIARREVSRAVGLWKHTARLTLTLAAQRG
jgi:stearoyl-CoA desaturase (delta-9 desaturase)